MRCKPGDLAVVVAEFAGCECNIGATLTVIEADAEAPVGTWGFRNASRPLKTVDDTDGVAIWVKDSDELPEYWFAIYDKHLVPIRDPGDDAVDEMSRPLPAEVVA